MSRKTTKKTTSKKPTSKRTAGLTLKQLSVKDKKANGSKKRKEWTKEHDLELRGHSRARTHVPEIAKLMKRTESALRQRAHTLGMSLGHRNHH